MRMKTLYLECSMGAAGDMLMAALYELLEDKPGFLEKMNSLGLPGVHLEAESKTSCGITGTHMRVTVHGQEEDAHHDHHHHSGLESIQEWVRKLALPSPAKAHVQMVYDSITQAEATVHGCPVDEVHFHEVGALDAIADIAGVCYAMHLLQPDRIVVSPIHVGSGTVRCAHGVMPVPAPATAVLLTDIPTYGGTIQGELCTPTGAALLAHFGESFGSMPVMAVRRVGYGLGSRVFDRPNCVRAFWGQDAERNQEELLELVCNIDDMTPEALAFACEDLLRSGALDVYIVPGTMKKGRPGHVLTVLCSPSQKQTLVRQIFSQTTTNGLRVRQCEKYFLYPSAKQVDTLWGTVRVKTAEGFGITHTKPEFDDVARIAREQYLPFDTVSEAVRKNQ